MPIIKDLDHIEEMGREDLKSVKGGSGSQAQQIQELMGSTAMDNSSADANQGLPQRETESLVKKPGSDLVATVDPLGQMPGTIPTLRRPR